MAEIVSKIEYAQYAGVTPSAVSMWIKRNKLTAPALRADGTIDRALADAQLSGGGLDIVRHIGRGGSGAPFTGEPGAGPESAPAPAAPSAPAQLPEDQAASRLILRSRAVSAQVDAERKRRELNEERGKYVLAQQVSTEWARGLSGFLQSIELSFADLAEAAALDRQQMIAVRQWWRTQRQRAADQFAVEAAAEAAFVEDTVAA